jgi:hypothetical protein
MGGYAYYYGDDDAYERGYNDGKRAYADKLRDQKRALEAKRKGLESNLANTTAQLDAIKLALDVVS